jgi:hypothetical protein
MEDRGFKTCSVVSCAGVNISDPGVASDVKE